MEHRCPPSPRAGFTHKCTHFSSQSLVPTTTLFTLVYWESQGQMKFFMAASLCDWFPHVASLVGQRVKNLPAMQKTRVRSLGQEDPPGEGKGYPLQYSCLENPMNRRAWPGSQRVRQNWATNTFTGSVIPHFGWENPIEEQLFQGLCNKQVRDSAGIRDKISSSQDKAGMVCECWGKEKKKLWCSGW